MFNTAYKRLTAPPKHSFFLLGVRGVGKSTWERKYMVLEDSGLKMESRFGLSGSSVRYWLSRIYGPEQELGMCSM